MRRICTAIAAVILWYVPAHGATAQQAAVCASTSEAVSQLEKRFGESPRGMGVTASGRLVVLFTNAKTRTFTLTVNTARGLTCVVSSGENWQWREQVAPEGSS